MSNTIYGDNLYNGFNTDFRNDEVLSVTFTMEPDGTAGFFEYTAICGSQSECEYVDDLMIRNIRNQVETYNKTAFQPIEVITELLS